MSEIETSINYRRLSPLQALLIIVSEIFTNTIKLIVRPVRRYKERINAEYDEGRWQKIFLQKRWLQYQSVYDYVIPHDQTIRVAKIKNHFVSIKTNDYYRYRLTLLQNVLKQYADDVDTLCELGCGWGMNLFSLALANHWKFFEGFDVSQNAIAAAKAAAQHFNMNQVKFGQIDLTNSSESAFQELSGKVVFTYHCLEQLKHFTPQVIENIYQAKVKRVIHIEPTTELLKIWLPKDLIDYLYIMRQDYQNNLLKTIVSFERKGLIKILEKKRLYYAPTPRHDNVLICWEPL